MAFSISDRLNSRIHRSNSLPLTVTVYGTCRFIFRCRVLPSVSQRRVCISRCISSNSTVTVRVRVISGQRLRTYIENRTLPDPSLLDYGVVSISVSGNNCLVSFRLNLGPVELSLLDSHDGSVTYLGGCITVVIDLMLRSLSDQTGVFRSSLSRPVSTFTWSLPISVSLTGGPVSS